MWVRVEAEESDIITDAGSEKFLAIVTVQVQTTGRELSVRGPERERRAEALKDGEVLEKAYEHEGESGLNRVSQRLERKMWSTQELKDTGENSLAGLIGRTIDVGGAVVKQDKLIPYGEGWQRQSDEMLWEPRSGVYFAQLGPKMGQYLMTDEKTKSLKEVGLPHRSVEHPILARGAFANVTRRGAKMERTVVLGELPKIARLAMKFPLSFLDSPASAYALFQGFRSAEAADWCAKNFHTKLIPQLASKIHTWEGKHLQEVLRDVLKNLDAELLRSSHAFSGCSCVVALLLGNQLTISGVGQARVVLLFEDGSSRQLLACTHGYQTGSERLRVEAAGGVVRPEGGLLRHCSPEGCAAPDEAKRILCARHAFEVMQLEPPGPNNDQQIRTAYRKLALQVHPDKIPEGADVEAYNKAFTRLEKAKDDVETMLAEDGEACRELNRILRADPHTREGAAELLDVDKAASVDTEAVCEAATASAKRQVKKLTKMEAVPCAAEALALAAALCNEAVETLRRGCSPEALPRQEALLKVGVPMSRAMGARDLRFPEKVVCMEPESTSWHVPNDKRCRVAMLCGATAQLTDQQLTAGIGQLRRRPKASALRWCQDSDSAASSAGAICVAFEPLGGAAASARKDEGPAAKRQRAATLGQNPDAFFLRHILFRNQQQRAPDPGARRDGKARGPGEAESAALAALDQLLAAPTGPGRPDLFLKLCKELSDCQTADQPGKMAGHLGWVGKGEGYEQAFEDGAFVLGPNEYSDVVVTSRGVHILQRLG